ncbi:MAG: UDP-N-acetylmuramoyl-L-alanyl-D-glutamate--2,6-diaminopimelate ligase [Planctomycetota bacterium]|nr:UDP-N-acetylmuramoyl-L-alanyl-D-glutamate--2,6-diaminopimelate ligase [Planctomycetota bacterium]
MLLNELVLGLNLKRSGADAIDLPDLADDSRAVKPGSLFIARPGSKGDGRTFIADALSRGAAAVLAELPAPADLPKSVAWVQAPKVDHALVGEIAERFFGRPAQKLKLIGVTGTNGKTTIAFVVAHLLARAGVKCGIIGTVVIDDGATRTPAELTTPGAIDFSRHLAAMVRNGCAAAVAEVSSHALHQGRASAFRFAVGVFTNLTGDHLDYHGTMENYAAAKAILFEGLGPEAYAVVNAGDAWTPRLLRDCKARVIPCEVASVDEVAKESAASGGAQRCVATILAMKPDHTRVRFDGPWGSLEVNLPLVGRHNAMNVLQAVAAANCVTSMARSLSGSLEACPAPPGRLEPVRLGPERLKPGTRLPVVLVDYAHTHDALENVLTALRPLTTGKIITLFGCGGDRDRTKRPKMAAVACKLSDRVVVTSDNPRTEDPMFIIGQILEGVPTGLEVADVRPTGAQANGHDGNVTTAHARASQDPAVRVEPDRARAIVLAVSLAGPDDVVLLAGKGHEDYQIIGTTKRHFDDREEAARALERRAK